MPIINVTTLQDILGGTAPADALFTAYMMRASSRAVRVQDDEVIFPAQVYVKFVDGEPEEPIELETPPADCYWSIRIKGPERVLLRTNVILPLGAGPFDFDELIEVIPETALPDAGTALAEAFLEAVQSATVGATGPTGPEADTGDITFNGVKIIGAGDASGDGNGYGTMELVPDATRYETDQYLIVDPTEPNHIHIRAGGEQDGSYADLILGAEDTHVYVSDASEQVILRGANGQYLGDSYPENQIATIEDLGVDTEFQVAGGTLGTQPTFDGDPLFYGSYVKHGLLVHFRIDVDFDNITSFGTGQYYLDLPFPSKYNYEFTAGCLHDISATRDYPMTGHVYAGESRMLLKSLDASGNSAFAVPFTATLPITLTVADNFHISGDYIALEE
jgi:hypothetical protein